MSVTKTKTDTQLISELTDTVDTLYKTIEGMVDLIESLTNRVDSMEIELKLRGMKADENQRRINRLEQSANLPWIVREEDND